jgi:hypothetical protein
LVVTHSLALASIGLCLQQHQLLAHSVELIVQALLHVSHDETMKLMRSVLLFEDKILQASTACRMSLGAEGCEKADTLAVLIGEADSISARIAA